jgi:hypothetical protein
MKIKETCCALRPVTHDKGGGKPWSMVKIFLFLDYLCGQNG